MDAGLELDALGCGKSGLPLPSIKNDDILMYWLWEAAMLTISDYASSPEVVVKVTHNRVSGSYRWRDYSYLRL